MRAPPVLLALLVVAVGLPANADMLDADGVCDGDEAANVQCEVILGPASVTAKSVATLGIGFCQVETTDVPLQCEGAAGDINGVGAATFGDDTWTGGRAISINVVNDQQTCTAATSPPCGFTVDICNDRDQDSTCTNIGDQDDELYSTAASEGALGTCKDEQKDCDDPNEAGWSGCMPDSVFNDWSDEQIIVFIGIEAGPSVTPPDVQAAISTGTYTVWMEDGGASTCSGGPPGASSSGCIWERDSSDSVFGGMLYAANALEDPGNTTVDVANDTVDGTGSSLVAATNTAPQHGVCEDDGGNPVNFVCDATAAFMIVINVGAGSTSATNNSCSGQNPQTASGTTPVNVQAATGPGTFNCEFHWVVVGAGACFVDVPAEGSRISTVNETREPAKCEVKWVRPGEPERDCPGALEGLDGKPCVVDTDSSDASIRIVTCTVEDACEKQHVRVSARLKVGGAGAYVETKLKCDERQKAPPFGAPAGVKDDKPDAIDGRKTAEGDKDYGDYVCVVTFKGSLNAAGKFAGTGKCEDWPAKVPPSKIPPGFPPRFPWKDER